VDYCPLFVGGAQVGMPGPQVGIGMLSVADWWLRTTCIGEEEKEAAAAPAITTDRAKMRTTSFMMSNPFIGFERPEFNFPRYQMVAQSTRTKCTLFNNIQMCPET
jgi:hypothetical protein